jgi:hypothetical protein
MFVLSALGWLQPAKDPIIVKIIEPPAEVSALADVLLGALGITGIIVLAAVVLGVLMAGILFFVRWRSSAGEP